MSLPSPTCCITAPGCWAYLALEEHASGEAVGEVPRSLRTHRGEELHSAHRDVRTVVREPNQFAGILLSPGGPATVQREPVSPRRIRRVRQALVSEGYNVSGLPAGG